jgi:hypothetical protein
MEFVVPKHTNSVLLWKLKKNDVKNVSIVYSRILQTERKTNKLQALNI